MGQHIAHSLGEILIAPRKSGNAAHIDLPGVEL
jgi:hypothetical protein